MSSRKIIYYEKKNGETPVELLRNKLNPSVQKKIFFVFKIIEDFRQVSTKFFKKMTATDDLWEIRVEYQSNTYRFFGFLFKGKILNENI